MRAARWLTLNVPNPTRDTFCFFLSVALIAANAPANALPAEAFERLACLAIASMSSVLFT